MTCDCLQLLKPGRLVYRTSGFVRRSGVEEHEIWKLDSQLTLKGESKLELRILLANAEYVAEIARAALADD